MLCDLWAIYIKSNPYSVKLLVGYIWYIYCRYIREELIPSSQIQVTVHSREWHLFVCLFAFIYHNKLQLQLVAHAICADRSYWSQPITLNGAWACSEGHQTRSHQPSAIIHTGRTLLRQTEGRLQQHIWTTLDKTLLQSSALPGSTVYTSLLPHCQHLGNNISELTWELWV